MRKYLYFLGILGLAAACTAVAAPNVDDLLSSARQAMEKGDRVEALRYADQAVDVAPKRTDAYALRAAVHDARREFQKAVDDYSAAIALSQDDAAVYQRRGEDHFRLGHFKESVADFDKVIELNPGRAAYHWQRGISLYYAGEYERGARQFELHQTVNPQDVENAVWHFLCVAKLSGVGKARQGLIPIRSDTRVPMMEVYALFVGKASEKDVLDAARAGNPAPADLKEREFYAHLYLGLYYEAMSEKCAALERIRRAVKVAPNDYMGDVARISANGFPS